MGPFMCSNTDLNKTKLPTLRAMLEGCKAHDELCGLSDEISHYEVFRNKGITTASVCALAKTLAHQLPAHEASAGDIAVLLEQEEAEARSGTSVQSFLACSVLELARTQSPIQS